MTSTILAVFAALGLGAPAAFGHGERTPGPHGGVIRMTADFHVETVTRGPTQLEVYLLDVDFAHPVTRASSVEVVRVGAAAAPTKCKPAGDAFVCALNDAVDVKAKGQVQITAVRAGRAGPPVLVPTSP